MIPGEPIAVMLFKTFCEGTAFQASVFLATMKLGHYMKVPPRTMFLGQVVATIITSFVVTGVMDWQISNIPDFCAPDQKRTCPPPYELLCPYIIFPDGFTCPGVSVFNTAATLWGGIG